MAAAGRDPFLENRRGFYNYFYNIKIYGIVFVITVTLSYFAINADIFTHGIVYYVITYETMG